MATGGTTLLEMVNIWHLGTIVSCFIPKEPPHPSSGGRLWRCVPLGVAEPAQVSTPAGASEHSHSYPDRWSLIWKREGRVQTRRGMSAHHRTCHSHPYCIFEKSYCSDVSAQKLPALGISLLLQLLLFTPPVSSPGPQPINILELINICVLFFWEVYPYLRVLKNRKLQH